MILRKDEREEFSKRELQERESRNRTCRTKALPRQSAQARSSRGPLSRVQVLVGLDYDQRGDGGGSGGGGHLGRTDPHRARKPGPDDIVLLQIRKRFLVPSFGGSRNGGSFVLFCFVLFFCVRLREKKVLSETFLFPPLFMLPGELFFSNKKIEVKRRHTSLFAGAFGIAISKRDLKTSFCF